MVVATAGMQAGTTISISVSIGYGLCGIGRPLFPPIHPAKINISNLHYRHHINTNKNTNFLLVRCSSSSSGGSGRQPGRGFGSQQPSSSSSPDKSKKETTATDRNVGSSQQRKSNSIQSGSVASQAPGINSRRDGKSTNISFDVQFEERLEAIKRSALEQKKVEEKKDYGTIDYDEIIESQPSSKIGLGAKIGVGVAVVVFGLVFALGDFLPSGSLSTNKEATVLKNTLPPEEKAKLQTRLQQFEAKLNVSPEDPAALEGAAVTLTELGEYTRAVSLLEDLTKKKPRDPDALRLLGEVKYELKDYEGSATAYRSSAVASDNMDFEVLRGLTNALLAAKKPDEAVQILLTFRESLNKEKPSQTNTGADGSTLDTKVLLDPIQVELLLGKAYSDWGHISDAVSVYDQIISSHPDDFRGYLAKGIILKENGKYGDAERMFIQARFFAPEGAKGFVDRYSR